VVFSAGIAEVRRLPGSDLRDWIDLSGDDEINHPAANTTEQAPGRRADDEALEEIRAIKFDSGPPAQILSSSRWPRQQQVLRVPGRLQSGDGFPN
jgi:hypothetical protein